MKTPFKIPFALVMAVLSGTFLCLVLKCVWPVTFLFSGEVFTRHFQYVYSPDTAIGDSFQVGVNKLFLASFMLAAVICPVLLGLRISSDLNTKVRKHLFAAFSIALGLFPISALSVAVLSLLRYLLELGLTPARIEGIICGLSGIGVITLFLFLVIRTAPAKRAF